MWDKSTRKVIFLYLYNLLFWDNFDVLENPDAKDKTGLIEKPENFGENININSLVNLPQIDEIFSLDADFKLVSKEFVLQKLHQFKANQINFETQLKDSLSNWSQTYTIVKAILFTFILENESIAPEAKETTLIGKYLRLSQEYGNSQSVAVIHAVLAKFLKTENS